MDCRSCGTVNAPGRRYCRECGGRLGSPCPSCAFFNSFEDKHCGGCARRLRPPGAAGEESHPVGTYAPASPLADDIGFGEEVTAVAAVGDAGASISGQGGVSQSEIDGLFENILDEESTEGEA